MELDIDIGADAKDWSAIQATEKLKPVEADLRRMEEMVGEIVSEMDYLRTREQKLRDTNESTNNRVKWFGFGTTFLLIALWVWQVLYLRAYFRWVDGRTDVLSSVHGRLVGTVVLTLFLRFHTGPSILSRMREQDVSPPGTRIRRHGDTVGCDYPEFRESRGWLLEDGSRASWDTCTLIRSAKALNDEMHTRRAHWSSVIYQVSDGCAESRL